MKIRLIKRTLRLELIKDEPKVEVPKPGTSLRVQVQRIQAERKDAEKHARSAFDQLFPLKTIK